MASEIDELINRSRRDARHKQEIYEIKSDLLQILCLADVLYETVKEEGSKDSGYFAMSYDGEDVGHRIRRMAEKYA